MIIADQRARSTGLTPVLGRGFSLSTNTYQSVCLTDVVTTEPSYDFSYQLDEISEESLSSSSTQTASISSRYNFVRSMIRRPAKSNTKVREKRTRKFLGMSLTVDTYHSAVEESKTPLSDYAAQLLQREDTPGFFAACGTYYVRGISRRAEFNAVFEYEEKQSTSETRVKDAISNLVFAVRDTKRLTPQNRAALATLKSAKVVIFSQGRGLGYGERNQLISFDLDGFRSALRAAFGLMQKSGTGRVTSVEVVPWTENLKVQSLLELNERDEAGGGAMPLFRKKEILTHNAEYLATLHRSLQKRKARYYLARDCSNQLNAFGFSNWMILKNHTNQGIGVTVKRLKTILDNDKVTRILRKESYFDYLVDYERCVEQILSGPPGAIAALDKRLPMELRRKRAEGNMMERRLTRGKALFLFRYTSYKECTDIDLVPPAFPGFEAVKTCCLPVVWGNPDELPEELLSVAEYREAFQAQSGNRISSARTN